MSSCEEITRLLSEAQERPLTLSEKVGLRFHNLLCGSCRNFEKHMGVLRLASQRFVKGEYTGKK